MITIIENGFIVSAQSEGNNDEDYSRIAEMCANKPHAEEGYDYRLKADTLEWELYELPEEVVEETT